MGYEDTVGVLGREVWIEARCTCMRTINILIETIERCYMRVMGLDILINTTND